MESLHSCAPELWMGPIKLWTGWRIIGRHEPNKQTKEESHTVVDFMASFCVGWNNNSNKSTSDEELRLIAELVLHCGLAEVLKSFSQLGRTARLSVGRGSHINFSLLPLKLLIYVPQRRRWSQWTLARFPFHNHGVTSPLYDSTWQMRSMKATLFFFPSIFMLYAVCTLVKEQF